MDIYCPKSGCGEPVEMDYAHDVVDEGLFDNYSAATRAFQTEGCTAWGLTHSTGNDSMRSMAMDAMFDLMGDDIDGAAAMMEDFEYFGMLD